MTKNTPRCVEQIGSRSIVLAPKEDVRINTPFASIDLAARSLVLIVSADNGIAVCDFLDRHSGAVVMQVGGRAIDLNPGTAAVVVHTDIPSDLSINFAQLFQSDTREKKDLGTSIQASISEFTLPQAIQALQLMRQIIVARSANSQFWSDNLLNTISILLQLNSASQTFCRPENSGTDNALEAKSQL